MGELKPIGSEKLKGDAKIQRILELTYFNSQVTSTAKPNNGAEYISETVNGVYGIVKEKDGYYVKKGLNENTLDYIGGMFMKNKNKFHSYSEALKRLDYIQGQESLNEETKYVLKVNKPTTPTESPMSQPAMDAPAPDAAPPTPETGDAPSPDDMETSPDMGDTGMGDETDMGDTGMESEDDYLKTIQKLTGKLGQKLRGFQDKLEGNDVKYVINSVLSALDLDKLEMNDKEEILNQFEDDEEGTDEFGGEPSPETDVPAGDMGTGTPGEDSDLGEDMDALEQLINTPLEDDDSEEDYVEPSSMENDEVEPYVDPEDDSSFDHNDIGGAFEKFLAGQGSLDINNDEEDLPVDYNIDGEFSEQDIDPNAEEDTDLEPEPDSVEDDSVDEPSGVKFSDEPSLDNSEDDEEEIGEPKKNEVDREFAKFLKMTNNLGDGFDDEEVLGKKFASDGRVIPGEVRRATASKNDSLYANTPLDDEFDDGYTSEMSEGDIEDSQTKEIEIDELTNMINNTVKETLGKYFK